MILLHGLNFIYHHWYFQQQWLHCGTKENKKATLTVTYFSAQRRSHNRFVRDSLWIRQMVVKTTLVSWITGHVSTIWAVVIFRVKWRVVVCNPSCMIQWRCAQISSHWYKPFLRPITKKLLNIYWEPANFNFLFLNTEVQLPGPGVSAGVFSGVRLYKEQTLDASLPLWVTWEGIMYFGPGLKLEEKARCLWPKLKAGLCVFVMSWLFCPTVPGRRYFAGPGPRHLEAVSITFDSLPSFLFILLEDGAIRDFSFSSRQRLSFQSSVVVRLFSNNSFFLTKLQIS